MPTISIFLPAEDGWDKIVFPSIEEAQDALEKLDASLENASGYRAMQITDTIVQLEEAIAEAQLSSIDFPIEN